MAALVRCLFRILLLSMLVLIVVVLFIPRTGTAVLALFFPAAVYHHDDDARTLTLAIDDGPDPSTTLQISELLYEADIDAVFFLIGEHVERYPNIVSMLHSQGHQIGAHFYEDGITVLLDKDEASRSLLKTLAAMPDDVSVEFARPGYGVPSRTLLDISHAQDLRLVVGDIPAFDTLGLPNWFYLAYLRLTVRNGSIVTFHDRGTRGERTIRTLPIFIRWARDSGYGFDVLR